MQKAIMVLVALITLSASLFAAGVTEAEPAEQYPRRPIELIVPFGAGGSSDIMTRQVAQIMRNFVDVPVNVVNRAGGGGIDGMVYVANQPADGYSVLQVTPSHAIAAALGRPNADLLGSFEPVANFQVDIQVFGVSKDSPFQTIQELIAYARQNPGRLKIGGTSPGGLDEYMASGFAREAGIELLYVPYASAAETKAATLGGELDIYQDKIVSFLPMVRSGDIRPLVVLGDARLSQIPELADVPCTVELGINFTQGSWRGYAVRKGTPQHIIDFLADAIEQVYRSDEYQRAAAQEMSDILPGFRGSADYRRMWESEIAKFRTILAR